MKKIILCLLFVVLVLPSFTTVCFAQSETPVEPPCVCCPPFKMLGLDCMPPDAFLSEDMYTACDELNDIQKELSEKSKYVRAFALRIAMLIKKVKAALSLSSERCAKLISASVSRIDSTIETLESRKCSETNVSKRCIPANVVDEYVPRMRESLEGIKSIYQIDDDESGLADVCRG